MKKPNPDWPADWPDKSAILAAAAKGATYDQLMTAAKRAERGKPVNRMFMINVLKRLSVAGEIVKDEARIYRLAPGAGTTEPPAATEPDELTKYRAALECLLVTAPIDIEADTVEEYRAFVLRTCRHALGENYADESPTSPDTPSTPFAGPPEAAVAACRAILRDNEAQALTLAEWDELAAAEGIDLAMLARERRAEIHDGVATTDRDGQTAYWLPAPAPASTDDDLPV